MDKLTENNSMPANFKGYTLDELRYRRAFALAKYEIAKMQMSNTVMSVRQGMSGFGSKGIVGKILGNLNYVDYAILGFRVISKIRKWRKARRDY